MIKICVALFLLILFIFGCATSGDVRILDADMRQFQSQLNQIQKENESLKKELTLIQRLSLDLFWKSGTPSVKEHEKLLKKHSEDIDRIQEEIDSFQKEISLRIKRIEEVILQLTTKRTPLKIETW